MISKLQLSHEKTGKYSLIDQKINNTTLELIVEQSNFPPVDFWEGMTWKNLKLEFLQPNMWTQSTKKIMKVLLVLLLVCVPLQPNLLRTVDSNIS